MMMLALDVIVRSSLMLAIGLALMPVLRQQSAALRHLVLFTSLMCAAAMPVFTWLMPTWEVVEVASVVPRVALASVAAGTGVNSAIGAASQVELGDTTAVSQPVGTYALLLWMFGTAASFVLLLVGVAQLYRVDADSTPVDGGPWRDEAPSPTTVRATPRAGLLLVWGIRRPSIIVPVSALDWPADRTSAVLRHELAHIRRGDWALQIAGEAVRAIYWFNPLVWLACARLRAECEIACDDAVIAEGATGTVYASHVIEVAQALNEPSWLPAPAIVRQSTLERRIRAMLDKTRNRRPVTAAARGSAIALLFAASVAMAAVAAQSFVSLTGTIVDPSNGVLPGVKLILVNEETKAKYEIQTNQQGRYEFVGLPPGNYTMDAALPGFSRYSARVTVGSQNVQQDMTMGMGTLQETITIVQNAPPPAPDPERDRRIEAMRAKRAAAMSAPRPARSGNAVGGNLGVPLKVRDVRPVYPTSLYGTEGKVVLNTTITTSGAVGAIDVKSATHPDFAQAAIDAVAQWVFTATLLNGDPVETPMEVTVSFRTQ
jgi:TonB family protein